MFDKKKKKIKTQRNRELQSHILGSRFTGTDKTDAIGILAKLNSDLFTSYYDTNLHN